MKNNTSNIVPEGKRQPEFQRNMDLESFLMSLNDTLSVSEDVLLDELSHPDKPILMLVGPMRSGTTLMMQWLAQTGLVAYPSNLISRFFKAPIIGAKIQQLLTDPKYQFRDEFSDIVPGSGFASQNGKTTGFLAPNEFWYFWQQFINSPKSDSWTDAELAVALNSDRMLRELHGLTSAFGKPFATKAMKFNYAIKHLHSLSKQFVFMHIHRKPAHNMASVLAARQRQYGSINEWYSFKVPEHHMLKNLSPQEQVAGQIYSLNRAATQSFSLLPSANVFDCSYEAFCEQPEDIYIQLREKFGLSLGSHIYDGPAEFNTAKFNPAYGSEEDLQIIYDATSKIIDGCD